MCIESVGWALRQPIKDTAAKLILIAIANHRNPSTGECFPSYGKLAEAACCCKRTVIRKIQELVAAGWLQVLSRHAGGGRQTSNGFVITSPKSSGDTQSPSPPLEGDTQSPSWVTPAVTPTSFNRKNERSQAENYFSEEVGRQPPAEPQPVEERRKVGGLIKDFSASLRMSRADPPRPRRKRA